MPEFRESLTDNKYKNRSNHTNNHIFIYSQYRFFSLFDILYILEIKPPYTSAYTQQYQKLIN